MGSSPLTLYLFPGSSSLFPHILLRYCNLSFTPVLVNPSNTTAIGPINDKHQVPILKIGSHVVTENPAIAHAINRLRPELSLFGNTDFEFIKVCEWLNWIAAPLHAQAWGPYIRPFRFTAGDDEKSQSLVKESAEKKLRSLFARLESQLDPDGPWALGKTFTAVDAYTFPFYQLARDRMGLDMEMNYPTWTRIMKAMLQTEAVKAVLECEQNLLAATR